MRACVSVALVLPWRQHSVGSTRLRTSGAAEPNRAPTMVVSKVPSGAVPDAVVELCREVADAGFRAWVVGGSLRDLLLQRTPKDWDLATSATPQQVMRLFPRVIPTGIEHGTVTVSVARRELRGDDAARGGRLQRRPPARPRSLHHRHRAGPGAPRLHGQRARLRPARRPPDRSVRRARRHARAACCARSGRAAERFAEDGLRVLRAARFAATLEFELEPETERGDSQPRSTRSARVSPERVRDEWLRTLDARAPSRGFEVMRETGILAVTCPELVEQVGCTQNRYHAYDVWTHSMKCMDACDARRRCTGWRGCSTTSASRARARSPTRPATTPSTTTSSVGARMADALAEALPLLERGARARGAPRAPPPGLLHRRMVGRRGAPLRAARRHSTGSTICSSSRAPTRWARAATVERRARRPRTARASASSSVQRQGGALGTRDLAIDGSDVMQQLGSRPGPVVGQGARGAAAARARAAGAEPTRRAARDCRRGRRAARAAAIDCDWWHRAALRGVTSRRRMMAGFVDLHCHYIPGVDDGVRTVEEGVALCAGAQAHRLRDGGGDAAHPYRRCSRTRRADLDARFERFAEQAAGAAEHARARARRRALLRRVASASCFERGEVLPYTGGNALLVELPSEQHAAAARASSCFRMQVRGLRPVMAHPERYTHAVRLERPDRAPARDGRAGAARSDVAGRQVRAQAAATPPSACWRRACTTRPAATAIGPQTSSSVAARDRAPARAGRRARRRTRCWPSIRARSCAARSMR